MNIILVTVDAWRADFEKTHEGVPLLSALENHQEKLITFKQAYTNAPWTSPALLSVFTGESPITHGVHYEWSTPRLTSPGLAKQLHGRGWHCPNLSYLNRLSNYHRIGYRPEETPEIDDNNLLLDALNKNNEAPCFLWFHYKHTHLPYWASRPYREKLKIDDRDIPPHLKESVCTGFVVPRQKFSLTIEDREWVRRLYAAGVLEMNDWLSNLLEQIYNGPSSENTVVVVTSDHGEELLDHGHVGHASTAHHATLFEEVLRVPLYIIDPRLSAPLEVDSRVQGLDLYPTILGLAGVKQTGCEGLDLSGFINGALEDETAEKLESPRCFIFHSARMGCPTPKALSHHEISAISDGRHKLVSQQYEKKQMFLYDLINDPKEENPLTHETDLTEDWNKRLVEECLRLRFPL